MTACSLCGATSNEHPCQTPSGRHWVEIGGSGEPMPPRLAAAMTAPELRTPEQQALMDEAGR
jgi:hypothetical protein